jgi:hypothetical protein
MTTPQQNEQRLDEAEKLIKQVLRNVTYNLSAYSKQDRDALTDAWLALNRVTLCPDSDFQKKEGK